MPEIKAPRPPKGLATDGRRLWHHVVDQFEVEPWQQAILQTACEVVDRIAEARAAVQRDGMVAEGRFGPKAHPCLAVERDAKLLLLRSLREMSLDAAVVEASARPPLIAAGRRYGRGA